MKWLQSVAAEFTGYRRKATIGLVVVMLVMGAASVAVGQFEQRFSDVPVDDPNRIAIEWAADAGLTIGYGDGTFGPDDPMNQFEALLFMERFFDLGLAEGFTRGDMMGLMHAINQDFPLLNRTNCYRFRLHRLRRDRSCCRRGITASSSGLPSRTVPSTRALWR